MAVTLAVLAAIGLAWLYSGSYDVAATSQDGAVARWLLGTARRHSIAHRSGAIQVPPLNDPALVQEGFDHYHEMCEGCHLAPGMEGSELNAGLNPRPPLLAKAVPQSTPAELFWIIKNGIKMTGMPAFGASHPDSEIVNVVGFVRRLKGMTPEQYDAYGK
jgi:mono/diheme cytochrome c family protein